MNSSGMELRRKSNLTLHDEYGSYSIVPKPDSLQNRFLPEPLHRISNLSEYRAFGRTLNSAGRKHTDAQKYWF